MGLRQIFKGIWLPCGAGVWSVITVVIALIVVLTYFFVLHIKIYPTDKSGILITTADTLSHIPSRSTKLLNIVMQDDFEFDFRAVRAFSIERDIRETSGVPKAVTIIGYKDKEDQVQQWYFSCSEEKHKQLAEQFRKEILNK